MGGFVEGAPSERIPVETYAAMVRSALHDLQSRGSDSVPLAEALGRLTAAPVLSPIDLPPFRNSQMDGFAVRSQDVPVVKDSPSQLEPANHPRLPVARELAAAPGNPGTLEPGTAIRIMTGAAVPEGADAIVPVEDTTELDGVVTITRGRRAGEYVRERGSDLHAGDQVVPAGTRLASRHLGAIAASGLITVDIVTQVRVAVISTGSELVEPGTALGAGQIPDANGVALRAAVTATGAAVVHTGRVADDPVDLRTELDAAVAAGAEFVLTSGGISQGDHEVVRELLEPLGAQVGTVNMQPGGPQALGEYRGIPVVCFPGNPVSSQLSFELFVAPLLRELAGQPAVHTERHFLQHSISSIPGRRQYLRGRRLPENRVETVAGPGSHLVAALAASDLLIIVPEEAVELAAGESVETLPL